MEKPIRIHGEDQSLVPQIPGEPVGFPSRKLSKSYQNPKEILPEITGNPIRIQRKFHENPKDIPREYIENPIRIQRKSYQDT